MPQPYNPEVSIRAAAQRKQAGIAAAGRAAEMQGAVQEAGEENVQQAAPERGEEPTAGQLPLRMMVMGKGGLERAHRKRTFAPAVNRMLRAESE